MTRPPRIRKSVSCAPPGEAGLTVAAAGPGSPTASPATAPPPRVRKSRRVTGDPRGWRLLLVRLIAATPIEEGPRKTAVPVQSVRSRPHRSKHVSGRFPFVATIEPAATGSPPALPANPPRSARLEESADVRHGPDGRASILAGREHPPYGDGIRWRWAHRKRVQAGITGVAAIRSPWSPVSRSSRLSEFPNLPHEPRLVRHQNDRWRYASSTLRTASAASEASARSPTRPGVPSSGMRRAG